LKEYIKLEYGKWVLVLLVSVFVIISTPLFKIERCEADLESEKTAFLTLINQYRQQNGLPPLSVSSALTTAAQLHSEDMARRNYFSHTTPEGKTFVDRIRDAGYTYNTCLGENIAAGFSTAQSVFEAWKNSPGHNQNMLNPCFKAIGIGLAYDAGSTYKWYWTTDFGGVDDSGGSGGGGGGPSPPPPPPPSVNSPPFRPEKPSGPVSGYIDESYFFETSTVDPDGDLVSYVFDWGDGQTSTTGYVKSGSIVRLSHTWSKSGYYNIRIMAKDNRGGSSQWSPSTTIQIIVPIIELTFTSNIPGVKINVDGIEYDLPKKFEWPRRSVHNVSVPEIIEFMEGGRYFFKCWSDDNRNNTREITVRNETTITAIYEVQYLFSYRTHPNNFTSKWYTVGTVISLSAEPPIIDLGYGKRLVFKGWSNNASGTIIKITVNRPGFIEAYWEIQFLLKLKSPYGDLRGEGWYEKGMLVNFSVYPKIVEFENGTRRVFERWIGEGQGSYNGVEASPTILINSSVSEIAVWRTEYYLKLETEYGKPSGEGWYNVSSIARIFIDPVVYNSSSVRYVFQGWNNTLENGNNITIRVDAPMVLKADWRTEYYLNVSSEYGEVWGGGWYEKGSQASLGVKPPQSIIISYIFEGWSGDIHTSNLNATVIMDGPKNAVAKWRRDYMKLITIIVVLAIIVVSMIFYWSRRRRTLSH
jgi:hypothetical protein